MIDKLLNPEQLEPRKNLIGRSSVVPSVSGIYAWYFSKSPNPKIDIERCWKKDGKFLLYVGISPREPARSGSRSKNNLRKRIRSHMSGNASGSTLRLSLGCLLSKNLNIQLRLTGNTGRLTFVEGESILSDWMSNFAFVTWVHHDEPWMIEPNIIRELYLPLNLENNKNHPFYPILSNARNEARKIARAQPVIIK